MTRDHLSSMIGLNGKRKKSNVGSVINEGFYGNFAYNQKIEDILSMNELQIKEIKDHAYQTAKAYDVNDISQNLVDIFNGI